MGFLEDKRKEIADVDREFIDLMKRRVDLADEIGRFKAENDIPVEDSEAESRVIARYRLLADENGIDPDRAELIARALIAEAVDKEKMQIPAEENKSEDGKSLTPEFLENMKHLVLQLMVIFPLALVITSIAVGMIIGKPVEVLMLMAMPIAVIILDFALCYRDLDDCHSDASIRNNFRRCIMYAVILVALSSVALALIAVSK